MPQRNCRHVLLLKDEQSLLPVLGQDPDAATVYKVASYCPTCRWHIDVVVRFRNNGSALRVCKKGDADYPLHHFVLETMGQTNGSNGLSQNAPRTYSFCCSAPQCPVTVQIDMKPPHITDGYVQTLSNQALLRSRWEQAKLMAGDRADTSMARRVDGLDFLNTYLQDALNPVKGKGRIPLLNKKFLKTFGRDCDHILKRFGFFTAFEEEEDGQVQVWYLPKPDPRTDPLESTLRSTIEDARYELNTLITNIPELERSGARHKPMFPVPARDHVERALACHDYDKVRTAGRVETRSTTDHEEDHPYVPFPPCVRS